MRNLVAADVVFGGALAFLAGVAAASLEWNIAVVLLVAATAGFVILFSVWKLKYWKFLLFLLLLLFAGAFYYHFYLNIKHQNENITYNATVRFLATIADEPKIYDKYQSLEVELQPPLKGSVSILTSPLENYKYGDLLEIKGMIEPAQSVAQEPTVAFPKTISIIAEHRGFWLKEKLFDFKNYLLSQFQKSLPSEEAAFMGGLTLGSRSGFSQEFKEQMSLSGTTHVVVQFGYKIGIIAWTVAFAFGCFLSRRKTFYLTLAVIILFVLMVGAEASAVRAAIMAFLAFLARETGRIYNRRNAIALTALLMTFVDPTILVFNLGFQLSFLSLLGIAYLTPAFKKLFRLDAKNTPVLQETALVTLSAQLAVMPLMISAFGQFSLMAVLANVLIMVFVPFTMFLGFILAALSSIYFYLGFAVAKLAELLLFYEIGVIKLFAELSVPLPLAFNSWLATIFYYGLLVVVIYYFSPHKPVAAVTQNPT